MISNEVRVEDGYVNPVFVGITPSQKTAMIELCKVNASSMAHARTALENSGWDPTKAWTYLRIRGW